MFKNLHYKIVWLNTFTSPPRVVTAMSTPYSKYYLMGYIKGQAYKTPPANVDELLVRITCKFTAL